MNGWWQLLVAGVGGGGLAGLVTTLVAGMLNRPEVKANAVVKLTESALKQVDELQERTQLADREATAAREELAQARRQVRLLSDEIDRMLAKMRSWRTAILADPTTSLELREMVTSDPGPSVNGQRL